MTSLWEKWKQEVENSPAAFLNPHTNYSSEEEQNNRINICNSCEFFFKPTKQCKKCGCVMTAKVALKSAKCPINKW
jgi:hypothetical protein